MNNFSKVEVTVKLKKSQSTTDVNKWKCTINGEERMCTQPTVRWYSNNLEEALNSFELNEISSFTIEENTYDYI